MKNLIYFEIQNNKFRSFNFGNSIESKTNEEGMYIFYKNIKPSCQRDKLLNTILLQNVNGEIRINVDQFNTIPLFYGVNGDKIVFSNIFNEVAQSISSLTIDSIGFWESYLFESPFLDRTLIKEIRTIQPGCYLSVQNTKLEQKPYFSFIFKENIYENYQKIAFECLDENLYFGQTDRDIIFPISGGVDSRLLLSFFNKKQKYKSIKAITYGFNKSTFEYIYAKKVLNCLDINFESHDFHIINDKTYLSDIEKLIQITGGLIGIQNNHLYSYLSINNFKDDVYTISGFFADTIFGYAVSDSENNNIKYTKYYTLSKRFYELGIISNKIFFGIESDLKILFDQWKNSNITSFNEFLYIKERSTKFHMHLYNLYRTKIDTVMPLVNNNIIDVFMSMPSHIKKNKKIIFETLDSFFPSLGAINNISSSGRYGSGKGQGMTKTNYYLYLCITIINKVLINMLKVPIIFDNPYDTEKQDFFYLKKMKSRLINELNILHEQCDIDVNVCSKIGRRVDGMRNMQLITNIELIKKYILK